MEWKYKILMLVAMLFFHIWEDYGRQGILAQMKQKSWWRENYPAYLYRNDYKVALLAHAFSWAVFVMIPAAVPAFVFNSTNLLYSLIPLLIFNTFIHAYVDHMKANQGKLKLSEDQAFHLIQILLTWGVAVYLL